jgi:cortactin
LKSTDYSYGFGGIHGVQTDRVDKTAVGWDHKEKIEKHESQTDYSKGKETHNISLDSRD